MDEPNSEGKIIVSRVVITILVVIAITSALVLLWIRKGLAAAFFYFYFPLSILSLAVQGMLFLFFQERSEVRLVTSMFMLLEMDSLWGRIRAWAAIVFNAISRSLSWPVMAVDSLTFVKESWPDLQRDRIPVRLGNSSSIQLFKFAFFRLGIGLFGLAFFRGETFYDKAIPSIILASVMFDHLSYVSASVGFAGLAKRTTGSPLAKLAGLAALDVLVITILISGIIHAGGHGSESWKSMQRIAQELLTAPKHLAQLETFAGLTATLGIDKTAKAISQVPLETCLTFAFGMSLYLAMLKTIIGFGKELKRDDKDRVALADVLLREGKPQLALDLLEKCARSFEVLTLRCEAHLRLKNVEESKLTLGLLYRHVYDTLYEPDTDDIYLDLLQRWSFLDTSAREALVASAEAANLSQGARLVASIFMKLDDVQNPDRTETESFHLDSSFDTVLGCMFDRQAGSALMNLVALTPLNDIEMFLHQSLYVIARVSGSDRVMAAIYFDDWMIHQFGPYKEMLQRVERRAEWGGSFAYLTNLAIDLFVRDFETEFSTWVGSWKEQWKSTISKSPYGKSVVDSISREERFFETQFTSSAHLVAILHNEQIS
jgi:hypothetical protein